MINCPDPGMQLTNGSVSVVQTIALRTESKMVSGYRLAKKPNGELVLQGAFCWYQGWGSGIDWRDIPTVETE